MNGNQIFTCQNLVARSKETQILHRVNFEVNLGELHIILGQNGSGKSTFLKSIAGVGGYTVDAKNCQFNNQNLLNLSITERAKNGIFLSFQHPPAIPGLKLASLIKESVFAKSGKKTSSAEILQTIKYYTKRWNFDENIYTYQVNHGLSGGQQKMAEMLQAAMLSPSLLLLDEIDSGLDMDSIKKVAAAINDMRSQKCAIILVTHYRRVVDFLANVTKIHVMKNGSILKTGGLEIFDEIEKSGYESL